MTAAEAYGTAGHLFETQRTQGASSTDAMVEAVRALRRLLESTPEHLSSGAVDIATQVADFHGITLARLRDADRGRAMSRIRQEAAWRLRDSGLSYPVIGRAMSRDHSFIIVAVRAFEVRLAGDELLRARMARATGKRRVA